MIKLQPCVIHLIPWRKRYININRYSFAVLSPMSRHNFNIGNTIHTQNLTINRKQVKLKFPEWEHNNLRRWSPVGSLFTLLTNDATFTISLRTWHHYIYTTIKLCWFRVAAAWSGSRMPARYHCCDELSLLLLKVVLEHQHDIIAATSFRCCCSK